MRKSSFIAIACVVCFALVPGGIAAAQLGPIDRDTSPAHERRPLAASATQNADAASAPSAAPGSAWWQHPVVALAIVLGLMGGSAHAIRTLARRRGGLLAGLGPGGRAPAGLISVLARYPVGRGQTLVLLRLRGRVLVVCQTHGGKLGAGGGMSLLTEITDPDEVAALSAATEPPPSESGFRAALRTSTRQSDRVLGGDAPAHAAPPIVKRGAAGSAATTGAEAAAAIRARLSSMRSAMPAGGRFA